MRAVRTRFASTRPPGYRYWRWATAAAMATAVALLVAVSLATGLPHRVEAVVVAITRGSRALWPLW